MRSSLHVEVVVAGRTTTVSLSGALDAATAHRLTDLVVEGSPFVTLDLARVGFVDVAGWHAVRRFASALSDRGVVMTQVGGRASFDRLDAVLVGIEDCRRHPSRPACAA